MEEEGTEHAGEQSHHDSEEDEVVRRPPPKAPGASPV